MTTPRLSELEYEAWRGFLHAHDRIWREIEAGMAPLGVSMAEYSVLALLGEAGRKGMRMSDLAKQRLMSTGGFTRLADRLERRGLIERLPSGTDGRAVDVVLTTAGRNLLRKAWKQQHDKVRALFFGRLDDDDLRDLTRIWQRLSVEETGP